MRVRVDAGARIHIGFVNLSLAHERLYGGVGVALDEPRVVLRAEPSGAVDCSDALVAEYAERACRVLDVPGVALTVERAVDRHVGLGSGTQLSLSTLTAVAAAYDLEPAVREHAPMLGRGGRSGVGVAAFEAGGFIVDAGHPTERFTSEPPAPGGWVVPKVVSRHDVPSEWRFLLVRPETEPGRSGDAENESMRSIVERADPSVADDLAALLTRRLLPAIVDRRLDAFGEAVSAFGRLNGAWYAEEQGGVYRPPVGQLIDTLSDRSSVRGIGQSSWGPTVYGVTDEKRAVDARDDAERALDEVGIDGDVSIVEARNEGARVESI